LRGQKPLPKAYPRALCTIGDHLRRRRLDLGLLQREVAERLGADTCSVTNWELNHTTPALRFMPGIIRFLGYTPWGPGASAGERLVAYRRERGLPQTALARLLGIDPGTLSRWERGLRVPAGGYARLAEAFLRS
jgi:transcriptional regulator with XRE-family HTH domain